MRNKMIVFLIILPALLIMCVGCSSAITMPYSNEEYENGEWSIEELVNHFEELGFTEVEVVGYTNEIIDVYAEDDDSLFGAFEKGAEISASRKIRIFTGFEGATLTVDNCPELAEFIESGIDSTEKEAEWQSFLEAYNERTIEFDGTLTDWYDDFFWLSVSFTIAVEDSEQMSFSQSSIDFGDLNLNSEYDINKYHVGLITEGMRVRVSTTISQSENGWYLKFDSMKIIE